MEAPWAVILSGAALALGWLARSVWIAAAKDDLAARCRRDGTPHNPFRY